MRLPIQGASSDTRSLDPAANAEKAQGYVAPTYWAGASKLKLIRVLCAIREECLDARCGAGHGMPGITKTRPAGESRMRDGLRSFPRHTLGTEAYAVCRRARQFGPYSGPVAFPGFFLPMLYCERPPPPSTRDTFLSINQVSSFLVSEH